MLPALVYFHWRRLGARRSRHARRRLPSARPTRPAAPSSRSIIAWRRSTRFPAAVEDAIAATAWIAGTPPRRSASMRPRLAVGGDSAGGNLATVVALAARDRSGPRLVYQLLFYPAVEFAMTHDSHRRFTEGLPLTSVTVAWFRELYLRDAADQDDWRASPLRASALAGLAAGLSPHRRLRSAVRRGRRLRAPAARGRRRGDAPPSRRPAARLLLTMGRIIAAASTAIGDAAASLRAAFAVTPRAAGGAPISLMR